MSKSADSVRFCSNCGKPHDPEAQFCSVCGSAISKFDPVPQRVTGEGTPAKWKWIGATVVIFVLLVVLASVLPNEKNSSVQGTGSAPSLPDTNQNPQRPHTENAPPGYPYFSDGTHIVGQDVSPGTYRTRAGSPGCYYARLAGFSGTLEDIIANENTDAPAIITIAPTDRGFVSRRCGIWTQDLSAITSSRTTFGDGIYIIGTDIQAGTYRNDLGGHLKTGHTWTLQNRPTEQNQNKSIYTLLEAAQANAFLKTIPARFILT